MQFDSIYASYEVQALGNSLSYEDYIESTIKDQVPSILRLSREQYEGLKQLLNPQ